MDKGPALGRWASWRTFLVHLIFANYAWSFVRSVRLAEFNITFERWLLSFLKIIRLWVDFIGFELRVQYFLRLACPSFHIFQAVLERYEHSNTLLIIEKIQKSSENLNWTKTVAIRINVNYK